MCSDPTIKYSLSDGGLDLVTRRGVAFGCVERAGAFPRARQSPDLLKGNKKKVGTQAEKFLIRNEFLPASLLKGGE